jgi:hypothetical protein
MLRSDSSHAATSTATNGCPTAASLSAAYPTAGSASCPAGIKDVWGSAPSNGWTTYVRDDLNSSYFNSTAEKGALTYDANGDKKVWVRSVGVVQCRLAVLVALVSAQYVTAPFPESAISGSWFETTNNGNKLIIDTQGGASQSGGVSMRCEAPHTNPKCELYESEKEQVKPDLKTGGSPSPAMSATTLEGIKNKAIAEKTYFAAGKCPTSATEIAGSNVYIEGECNLSFTTGKVNSKEKPGFLVLVKGTFELDGNAEYFGTVYAMNTQESSGIVVQIHGNAQLTGSIVVDGKGGLSFGSSGGQGNANFIYDPTAVKNLESLVGASATRNSFRVLPVNQ